MRRLNCRPGELAIVINSFDPANIGSIVKVHGRDAKACGRAFIWKVQAAYPLLFTSGEKHRRRRKGSLADADLQPIRGNPLGRDITLDVVEHFAIQEGRLQMLDVDCDGTISVGVSEPKTNAQALRLGSYQTVDDLIETVESCPPLQYAVEAVMLEYMISLGMIPAYDDDDDWREWISVDEIALDWLIKFIDKWLDEDVDPSDCEYFQCDSGESKAMRHFERLDVATLDQLGVVLIDADQPGSSFRGAILREDIDYANQVARKHKLRFRFRRID